MKSIFLSLKSLQCFFFFFFPLEGHQGWFLATFFKETKAPSDVLTRVGVSGSVTLRTGEERKEPSSH